ncbi:hypothetical protein [Streptomyces albipurpureus]|uniref:Uncharacterized protein n=1 Tax=Streptomyces albipurpureus TaxID=2897419 RepID=A0ABT0UF88_9ACTN|nr:hypothetical protein [Streptomyces sp. CWNU-1]MCM2386807.1 hypothetical protein [Streptomyces sp. CWNU-1]
METTVGVALRTGCVESRDTEWLTIGMPDVFTYSLTIGLDTSIGYRQVVVDGGDRPLLGAEDGAGMGYWPAMYTWTMTPKRTLRQCQEERDVRPGQEPRCS